MKLRECAAGSRAFGALRDAYKNREAAARAWKAAGKPVVGELGCDVPEEILLAAGCLPVRVYASPEIGLEQADKYLEFSFDPIVRAQFEKTLNGSYHELFDRLVISNSTDVLIRIYIYLREIHRIEPEKPVPPIEFIDWLFTRFLQHQERNQRIIGSFREAVEGWTGTPVTDEAILEAAKTLNDNRAALRELSALRRGGERCLSGSEMLVAIGAGFFIDRAEHTALVRDLLAEAKSWPQIDAAQVYLTGSAHETTDLYDLLAECGLDVVSEDHDWGDRHMDRDVDLSLPPVKGIVDRYMLRTPSSKKSFTRERVETLCGKVRESGAQGVVFYMNIYEEAASWDYPEQRKALEEMGIPSLVLAKQPYPLNRTDELAGAFRDFAAQLKGGR